MEDIMDFSEKSYSYEIADTGIYELQIENAELTKTESGKKKIALTFVVRDNVEQKFSGTKIWETIWENEVHRDPQKNNKVIKKDDWDSMSPTEKQNMITRKEYEDFKIRHLVHAQDNDENSKNFKTKFNNIEEVVLFLNGMCVQAKVNKYMDDKTGKERNSIDYKTLKRTTVPCNDNSSDSNDDEDLPW